MFCTTFFNTGELWQSILKCTTDLAYGWLEALLALQRLCGTLLEYPCGGLQLAVISADANGMDAPEPAADTHSVCIRYEDWQPTNCWWCAGLSGMHQASAEVAYKHVNGSLTQSLKLGPSVSI